MKAFLIFIMSFMTIGSCMTFIFDAGLSNCSNQCKLQNKELKNFGWKANGKIFCECKEKEK